MDDEQRFWIAVWKIVAATFIALVAVIGGCSVHKDQAVKDLVRAGTPPADARCAIYGSSEERGCLLRFSM